MNVHLTIGEIITSLILYSIVHGFIWLVRNAESRLAKLISTPRGRIVHAHAKENHPETLKDCVQGDCGQLATIVAEMV